MVKEFYAAFHCEGVKTIRSKILWMSLVLFAFVGIMMGLLMFMAKHPELSGKTELMSTKTSFIKKTDWPTFFGLLLQVILSLGTVGYGVVTSWIFGREYTDRVINDLLALPVSRIRIVLSKFLVMIIWCCFLSLVIFGSGMVTGLLVGLDNWSGALAGYFFRISSGSAMLTILVSTPVAFIASYSRGVLLPVVFTILILIITQFVFLGVPGIIPYFPWAIPALFSGVAGADLPSPGLTGYSILTLTFLLGIAGTIAWWRYADQK